MGSTLTVTRYVTDEIYNDQDGHCGELSETFTQHAFDSVQALADWLADEDAGGLDPEALTGSVQQLSFRLDGEGGDPCATCDQKGDACPFKGDDGCWTERMVLIMPEIEGPAEKAWDAAIEIAGI